MRRDDAQAEVRRIAREAPDRVFLTRHAVTRDPAAGKHPLTKPEILGVLEHGVIVEGPAPDILLADGWKLTMRRVRDRRRLEVALVLVPRTRILVVTGYEDRA